MITIPIRRDHHRKKRNLFLEAQNQRMAFTSARSCYDFMEIIEFLHNTISSSVKLGRNVIYLTQNIFFLKSNPITEVNLLLNKNH